MVTRIGIVFAPAKQFSIGIAGEISRRPGKGQDDITWEGWRLTAKTGPSHLTPGSGSSQLLLG
ncbi:MAG: hypothetical protein DMG29_04750 [Acidobacteria bacterium]|nr:MAG: hypothetical protein DMG29_04750 [Acidobacteriota bacterium]